MVLAWLLAMVVLMVYDPFVMGGGGGHTGGASGYSCAGGAGGETVYFIRVLAGGFCGGHNYWA